MKGIIHVLFTLDMGGLETFVVNLAKKHDRARYNVSVCCFREGGVLRRELETAGIPVYTVNKREGIDYTLTFRLARLFREKNIDVVHTHNPMPWFYGAVAARIAGVGTVVHTEHSGLFPDRKKLLWAERHLAGITDTVISDSMAVTERLIQAGRITPEKICTILNGIDLERYDTANAGEDARSPLGLGPDAFVIGSVARLEPVKDHATLLEGFRLFSAGAPGAVLLLAGDGSMAGALKSMARKLGMKKNVVFLGTRKDVPDILKAVDVFAMTSLSEGLSLSVIEAMAARRPVIATRVGGNPEAIIDGKTGILIPPRDPAAFSEAATELYRRRDRAKAMGEAGRKRVEEAFDLFKMARAYEKVYDGHLRSGKAI